MNFEGHHLAELNIGRLLAPADDPRVAGFMNALDRINGIGMRMPGFVWMMPGLADDGGGDCICGDAQLVPNMTVWESVETLEDFVWNTVHRQFYERRAEWFEVLGGMQFVMWRVPQGHRPKLAEGLERLEHLRAHGDSDHAFGWSHLKQATQWREHRCAPVAAE